MRAHVDRREREEEEGEYEMEDDMRAHLIFYLLSVMTSCYVTQIQLTCQKPLSRQLKNQSGMDSLE